jgi:hypothetical protein
MLYPSYINHFIYTFLYTIMLDTIKIHIPTSQITPFFKTTGTRLLSNNTQKTTGQGEIIYKSGNFKNLQILQNHQGIYITGSLAKFRYDTNQKTLNLPDIVKTLEEIAEDLGLPIMEGKVSRIDIGDNIITKEPVENYYKILGETKHFRKYNLHSGLEFRSSNRCISIYNKINELKKENAPIIPLFENRYVLRYEYRLLNHATIANCLNKTYVIVKDTWRKKFDEVYKNHNLTVFNSDVFEFNKGVENQLTILGIENVGGLKNLLTIIKEARRSKVIHQHRATYLNNKFKALMQIPRLTQKSQLAIELEQKIKVTHFTASGHWQHIAF